MSKTSTDQKFSTGYKQTILGPLPNTWETVLLGDLFVFKNGLNKAKRFFGSGTPIVNYMDVFERPGLRLGDLSGRVSLTPEEIRNFKVQKGDVFFTRTSETVEDIGVASVMLYEPHDTVFSGFVLRARPCDGRLNDNYKQYCFANRVVRSQIISNATYTTRALTNGRILSTVWIAVPPIPEQRAIAEALSDVDGLLNALEALITKKQVIKQATMQQLLTGKTRLPGFSGAWERGILADFGVFQSGSGFPLAFQGHQSGNYPFFKVSDLSGEGNQLFMNRANHYISESVRRKLGAIRFKPESIVFAKIGAAIFLERKRLLSQESCLDNNMMAFTLTNDFACPRFFYYIFLRIELGKLVSATALPALSGRHIGAVSISIPPLAEQRAIASVLSDMDAEIAGLEQRRDKTRAIKQGMMQQLLTGRVRLSESRIIADDTDDAD